MNKGYLLGCLVLWMILLSCSDNKPEPWISDGVITGKIEIDEYGFEGSDSIPDNSGVTVTCFGAYGSLDTLTDKKGNYQFTGLGNGTYELFFEKENLGTVHLYSIQVFGFDTVKATTVEMYQTLPSTYQMPEFTKIIPPGTLEDWADDYVFIETDLPVTVTDNTAIRLYFNDKELIKPEGGRITSLAMPVRISGFDHYLYFFTIKGLPYESGKRIFFKAYICNPMDPGYWDPYTSNFVYSTLDERRSSNIQSFIMP